MVSPGQYAFAFKAFSNNYWDMSKPVLMDKTTNLLCRYQSVKQAADILGVKVKFVVLTRHPFSWISTTHPFDQGLYPDQ